MKIEDKICQQTCQQKKLIRISKQIRMNKQNCYLSIYERNVPDLSRNFTKQNLYEFAINFGQVHNLLGLMISDIIKTMGTLPIDQNININQKIKTHEVNYQKNDNLQHRNEGYFQKANKDVYADVRNLKQKTKFRDNEHIAQKMQIQKEIQTKNHHLPPKNSKGSTQKSLFNLLQFQFQEQTSSQQLNYPNKNQPDKRKKNIFRDILFQTQNYSKKSDFHNEKLPKQTPEESSGIDDCSQKTQSVQKVRYGQNQNYLQTNSIFQQDLPNDQVYNADRFFKDQKPHKQNKQLSIFDPFDNSQSKSKYPFQDPLLQKRKLIETPIAVKPEGNKAKSRNLIPEKYYPQSQELHNKYPQHSKKTTPSTQIKNQVNNIKPKNFLKDQNLLQPTYWPQFSSHMEEVQEQIDQIQSSRKKPIEKASSSTMILKRHQENAIKKQFDEYIPRRTEHGRKKVDRQNLKGSQCPDCRAFYEEVMKDDQNIKYLCQCSSRHKSSTTFMNKHKVQNYSQAFNLD